MMLRSVHVHWYYVLDRDAKPLRVLSTFKSLSRPALKVSTTYASGLLDWLCFRSLCTGVFVCLCLVTSTVLRSCARLRSPARWPHVLFAGLNEGKDHLHWQEPRSTSKFFNGTLYIIKLYYHLEKRVCKPQGRCYRHSKENALLDLLHFHCTTSQQMQQFRKYNMALRQSTN